jgi:hypothetical protein
MYVCVHVYLHPVPAPGTIDGKNRANQQEAQEVIYTVNGEHHRHVGSHVCRTYTGVQHTSQISDVSNRK